MDLSSEILLPTWSAVLSTGFDQEYESDNFRKIAERNLAEDTKRKEPNPLLFEMKLSFVHCLQNEMGKQHVASCHDDGEKGAMVAFLLGFARSALSTLFFIGRPRD